LLFLCNPQNPGGTIFTRAELARLGAFAEQHGLVICSDEIHADILLDAGKPHVPIASLAPGISRRTVTLVSPNKAFGFPGAGCAFAIIEDPELRRAFCADHHATVHDASVFGYEAALAAYRECGDWLTAHGLSARKPDLVAGDAAAGAEGGARRGDLPRVDRRTGLGVPDPYRHFLEHGVALSPGAQFGAPGFVRLNFGTQRALLEKALAQMKKASTGV
jgi:bifunctional pyridoxal-dependent enzyme with beta-cystathionase and maltose regulon repressor activities